MTGQLIYFAFLLVASGAMATFRWYQKKKVVMDIERAAREREQEILRTGRDPSAQQPTLVNRPEPARQMNHRPREADLMAERQEALRQLRRQETQTATGTTPTPAPAGGTITRELWPGGPVIVINAGGGGGTPAPAAPPPMPVQRAQPAPRPLPVQPPQQARPQKAKQPQKKQARQPVQRAASAESRHDEAYYARERSLARMKASSVSDASSGDAHAEPIFVKPTTPQQWRAAFIAAEVFGTPVSLRDHRAHGGLAS